MGTYHWEARTVDVNGGKSAWVEYGTFSVDFRVNAAPNAPTGLTQKDASAAAIPSPNGITNDTTVTLGGNVTDPDGGDLVKLQFEIVSSGGSFSGTPTNQEAGYAARASHSLDVPLSPGTYDWKARSADNNGASSAWATGGTFRMECGSVLSDWSGSTR